MTVKRYMWDDELYTLDKLRKRFEGFEFSHYDFDKYLEVNYTAKQIFNMNDNDKEEVRSEFLEHEWEIFLDEEVIELEITITPQEESQAICSVCPYKIAMKERLKNEM